MKEIWRFLHRVVFSNPWYNELWTGRTVEFW